MNNIENTFDYTARQFEIIDHLLTMGVGAHLAALVFFLVVSTFVAPQYRVATALSAIVMVSAGLILFSQAQMWTEAFSWNGTQYVLGNLTFTNGYRYVNWMVTIPCLLTQLLIVLGIRGKQLFSDASKLILSAWGMIITGYIGQLYEVDDTTKLLIWGAVSTLFFVYMNYIVGMRIFKEKQLLPENVRSVFTKIFWLMMIAWTLYPVAYLVPVLYNSSDGVVLRQLLFTVADISSKVVYGLMITYTAVLISASEGYAPAIRALGRVAGDKINS